jgi:2-polyprenyl-3-methyl-5-hydroxy-6-metoxy-1,4-benzoquinol methylase
MYKTIEQMCAYNRIIGRGYDVEGAPRPFDAREFFQISEEMGWNQNNPDYRCLFEGLARYIKGLPQSGTSLEFGCGPGYLINCLCKLGIKAMGVEANPYSKKGFDCSFPALSARYILDPTFSEHYGRVDLFIAIECFEHIPDGLLAKIMEKVSREIQPTYILFSSTPFPHPQEEWDIQWGHINLKQPAAWEAFFSRYGYALTQEKPPVTAWATLYKKING